MHTNADRFIDKRCFQPVERTSLLSEAERVFFNDNGYLVIRGLFDTERVRELRDAATRLLADRGGKFWISAPEEAEAIFKDYFWSRNVQDVITDLNGPSEILLGFLIAKPARSDRVKPWHQDGVYWGGKDQAVCALFTPLTPFNAENGPLYVIPGSHKLGRLFHEERADYNLVCDVSAFREPVLVEASPGDLVVVHSLTVHASFANSTGETRLNLGCHWRRKGSDIVIDDVTLKEYRSRRLRGRLLGKWAERLVGKG